MAAEAAGAELGRDDRPGHHALRGARVAVTGHHTLLVEALIRQLKRIGAEVVAANRPEDFYEVVVAHRPHTCIVEDAMADTRVVRAAMRIHRTVPDTKLVLLAHRWNRAVEEALERDLLQAVVPRSGGLPLLLDTLDGLMSGDRSPAAVFGMTRRAAAPSALSKRESEVLGLLATGATNAQIGERLGISVNTVRTHVHNLLQKLGVPQRSIAALRVAGAGPHERLSS